ncbi:hypothetical protein, partial [Paenibacillus forsythiae]|uniref:hypothetical protein n=1 Tax=Paenibacillus forsythiae TaxID=365616 RepID=UPI001E649873
MLFIAKELFGHPNYPVICQSGVIVPTTQALPNDYVTDSSGYVVGTIYQNRREDPFLCRQGMN